MRVSFEAALAKLVGASPTISLVGPLYDASEALRQPVVYVDGGSRHRLASEGLSVGDGDSFSGELDYQLPVDKDFSDLAYALLHMPEAVRHVRLLGFLDGRLDHEIINLGEAHRFLHRRPGVRLEFARRVHGFASGQWQIDIRGTFSLVAFAEAEVELTGACRYPISPAATLDGISSFGLSNVGDGLLNLSATAPVFLFQSN